MPASLVHIDRCPIFREGLRRLLCQSEFQVVWNGPTWQGGCELIAALQPELILFDFTASEKTACATMRNMAARCPTAKIVLLSELAPPLFLWATMRHVAGCLSKSLPVEAIAHSLALMQMGQSIMPEGLSRAMLTPRTPDTEHGLSAREVEMLSFLKVGYSNKEIANSLAITESTVKVHLKSVLRKVRVQNRTQAAVWAINHGVG